MAASVVVVAASIAMFPHCQSLAGFFICVIFTGIGCGTWECGLNIWIVELWPDHNGPMMQFSEFIYGLGTFIGPILVAPFVNGNANITVEERVTELTYPFAISGILHLIGKVLFRKHSTFDFLFYFSGYFRVCPILDSDSLQEKARD